MLPKKFIYTLITALSATTVFADAVSDNWNIKWQQGNGTGTVQGTEKKSGAYALHTIAMSPKDKCLFLRNEKIAVNPKGKYILSGYVKADTKNRQDSRIMLQYLDKSGKYKGTSHGLYSGGKHDWKYYERTTVIPEGIHFVRFAAGSFLAPGNSWFDDIKLVHADDRNGILASDGFEDSMEQNNHVWRIPIKMPKQKINAVVDINLLRTNADLFHYTGKNSLKGLSMTCNYQVMKPGNCYLSSDLGACYWYVFNLKSLKMSLGWSNEKLDLTSKGKKQAQVTFTSRDTRYFDDITKGPGSIRGHHYFHIYSPEGKSLGLSQSVSALVHPEASVFGKQQVEISESNRNSLFTLADLSKFSIAIDSFQADWKAKGKFAFKIKITDGEGDTFDINKVTSLNVAVDGEKLATTQMFDNYDIPQGWFTGQFDKKPENIKISAMVTAMTPTGKKINQINAEFTGNSSVPGFSVKPITNKTKEPEIEGRMIFISPHNILSKDPVKGKTQIKEIVRKAKESNINILTPFALGNRAWANYNIDNQYFRRIFKTYDPIAEFRNECSKANIKFHVIACTLPEGAEKIMGILKDHPDWAMRAGSKKKGWLDPSIPEVKAYRIESIAELVEKYKVDGVCLDYCRLSFGPSDRGAEIYQQEFGKDPRTFKFGSKDFIKWFKWTGNHLTDMVRQISERLRKINPDIKISAYVQGNKYSGEMKWAEYHQNYVEWVKKGYLDIVYPTSYIYDMLRFRVWSKRQIDTCRKADSKVPCMVTIGVISSHGRLRDSNQLIEQVNVLRDLNGDGASYFRWAGLEKWLPELKGKCYSRHAEIPSRK